MVTIGFAAQRVDHVVENLLRLGDAWIFRGGGGKLGGGPAGGSRSGRGLRWRKGLRESKRSRAMIDENAVQFA